jgi:hypothetical protein
MKSIHQKTACVLFVAMVFAFASCKKTNNASPVQSATTDSITSMLTTGSWTVGLLTQAKEDNTSKFKDYVLTFYANGKLMLVKNRVETQGSWSYTPAVTYYGSSSKEAFSINMGASDPFRRLTGTWNIISRSATSFKLDNPEIAEDEHLQLQKQ